MDDLLYIFERLKVFLFLKNIVLLSLMIDFVLANSSDADEMLHFVAFHLSLQCLPKYLLRVSCPKGLTLN